MVHSLVDIRRGDFVWDPIKELANVYKHGVDFTTAALAFGDPERLLVVDSRHSKEEPRYFCIGKAGDRILTVRFVKSHGSIRIFGAGCWRKWRRFYEKTNR